MNLSAIQRDIFMKNAKLRGEGVKKKPKKMAKKAKKTGGITIGGAKKKAPAKKRVGGKKALPAAARAWLELVKQVYASGDMSWKQALQQASKIYRKM